MALCGFQFTLLSSWTYQQLFDLERWLACSPCHHSRLPRPQSCSVKESCAPFNTVAMPADQLPSLTFLVRLMQRWSKSASQVYQETALVSYLRRVAPLTHFLTGYAPAISSARVMDRLTCSSVSVWTLGQHRVEIRLFGPTKEVPVLQAQRYSPRVIALLHRFAARFTRASSVHLNFLLWGQGTLRTKTDRLGLSLSKWGWVRAWWPLSE